jgi:hypothetical protein
MSMVHLDRRGFSIPVHAYPLPHKPFKPAPSTVETLRSLRAMLRDNERNWRDTIMGWKKD